MPVLTRCTRTRRVQQGYSRICSRSSPAPSRYTNNRVLAPTRSAPLGRPWCSSCTARSRRSLTQNKQAVTHCTERSNLQIGGTRKDAKIWGSSGLDCIFGFGAVVCMNGACGCDEYIGQFQTRGLRFGGASLPSRPVLALMARPLGLGQGPSRLRSINLCRKSARWTLDFIVL